MGLTPDQVALVLDCPRQWVEWAQAQHILSGRVGESGEVHFEPLEVEGLRRRLLRVAMRRKGALDPREAERVRLCLEDGARRRMRALREGRSYSQYPTIPPPPAGWLTSDEDVFDAYLEKTFTASKEAFATPAEEGSQCPVSREAHPEIVPPKPN